MRRNYVGLLSVLAVLFAGATGQAQEAAYFTRQEDVIYGRKFGTALTMDVFTPKEKANGAGVIFCVSGGWFSDHNQISAVAIKEYLKRGYTVFAVVHGSQPKFNLEEILQDMHRAVRYVRTHAKDYNIDGDRLGITGGSAGGHLSLMQGVAGAEGNPKAQDPVERASSRVQAVACLYPPTDFLNWGEPGKLMLGTHPIVPVGGAFAFYEQDKDSRMLVPVTDPEKRKEIGKKVSPIYHVSPHSAPTLIVHGDKDKLVPIEQAERFIAKLKETGVPAELITKKGGEHGGEIVGFALPKMADWFDKYLLKQKTEKP